jgi:hypothetical protein
MIGIQSSHGKHNLAPEHSTVLRTRYATFRVRSLCGTRQDLELPLPVAPNSLQRHLNAANVMSTSKIAVLGSKIQYLTADIQHSLENKKANSDSQDELLDTIEDLQVELVGPMKWTDSFLAPPDFSVMQVAFQRNIFQRVPIKSLGDGKGGEEEEEEGTTPSISIKELAALVKMDEGYLLRIMRLLAANKIFTEVEEKIFAHTTLSAGMAEENVAAHLGGLLNDVYKASTGLADAIQGGYPSAWEARFGTPMYEYFEKNLSQERVRMAKSMVESSRKELKELARIFRWKNFSKLVDIGGGAGHLAAYLAQVRTGLFHHSKSK